MQTNFSTVLMKAMEIIQNNSRTLLTCPKFYARHQMLQLQAKLLLPFPDLLNDIKIYRAAIHSYKLTIKTSGINILNKLIFMTVNGILIRTSSTTITCCNKMKSSHMLQAQNRLKTKKLSSRINNCQNFLELQLRSDRKSNK